MSNSATMSAKTSNEKPLGLWSVTSIGIGGMVGGGIFAVLGLAVELAKGGTPVAFFVAGMVALVTSYSYARLSVAFPLPGGTVEFLNQAFGPGIITGGLNVLLWISYLVMLSLYAHAFGSYGATFFPQSSQVFWQHVLMSGVIIFFTLLNALGAVVSGRAEELIVGLKLAILLFFIFAGISSVNASRLSPSTWSPPLPLVAGGMIIFVAYEGFELIANTGGDARSPEKTLPRAYFFSVGFVIVLYVLISIVAVGNLTLAQIAASSDYALAEAAKPFLGQFGFVLITIAALLSTSSAINATFYGSARISYVIAKEGELPEILEKKTWNRPIEGLIITSLLTLLIVNLFDLSSIAMMGSAGFLLIFAAVNASNYHLAGKTKSRRWISAGGCLVCLGALAALIWETATTEPLKILVLVVMLGLAFSIEAIYRKLTGRVLKPTFSPQTSRPTG
jgi:amino acid transporter